VSPSGTHKSIRFSEAIEGFNVLSDDRTASRSTSSIASDRVLTERAIIRVAIINVAILPAVDFIIKAWWGLNPREAKGKPLSFGEGRGEGLLRSSTASN
jgi:hypothetical protein